MALPLSLTLGNDFAALPIVVGVCFEIARSALRRNLKTQVRARFIDEMARQSLDKRALVPEAEVESAFWAADLLERAVTTDLPALIASGLAGLSILALSLPTVGATVVISLATLLTLSVGLTVWTNRWRQPTIDAMVERRQRVAAWVATAERDAGEIYGSRARAPFLKSLGQYVQLWSAAEARLDVRRLQQRLMTAGLFALGVLAILRSQHIDPFHLESDRVLSVRSLSGFLLLSTGIPACYVFADHADSVLNIYASLTQLLAPSPRLPVQVRSLPDRPRKLVGRGVRFTYPGSLSVSGLRPIDFDVDLRQLTLIVAPNGTGKTTLARLICGVLTADDGTLEIDGVPCSEVSRDDFGFVPQTPLIIDALTIEQNVRLVAPDSTSEAIGEALRGLGLDRPLTQSAGALSRGEQRRIAIARAILKEPRLLLLDEPDVWLDTEGRAALAFALERQLIERAVIVVSHRSDWLPTGGQVIDLQRVTPFGT